MAFVKKTWKDRIVQYANRRLLTKSGGEVEQVTVTRDEGTISEAGDQFNASNMNNLEKRVKDAFDDLNAEMLPIESGSATNTKDYIDDGLSGKADSSDLPLWIKQTSGQSLVLQMPFTFFYYYADQWNAHIPLPFIAKNNTYSITLTEVIAENIGNITAKCSVQSRTTTFFDIQTTKTMTALPDTFSTCVGRCKFTITFA